MIAGGHMILYFSIEGNILLVLMKVYGNRGEDCNPAVTP
jgi:hypothetical protein